jgi:hypothetical protein
MSSVTLADSGSLADEDGEFARVDLRMMMGVITDDGRSV